MGKLTVFQISVFIGCGILLVGGIIAVSLSRTSGGSSIVQATIWGTYDGQKMDAFFNQVGQLSRSGEQELQIQYVQKSAKTFDTELVEALAEGVGPDAVLLSQDQLWQHKDRLQPIPFTSYSERTFKDSFIEGGEVFLEKDSILALPMFVDPMVMYWNRRILTNEQYALPPRFWDEYYALAEKVTRRDAALNIHTSALSFGEVVNVDHAKDIISMLTIQAGSPIVVYRDLLPTSVFKDSFEYARAPAESALSFYVQFSNPTKPSFTWNKGMPPSQQAFIGEQLAIYFGYASEVAKIRDKNPNLNFDVAVVPQVREGKIRATNGKVYALGVLKRSSRPDAAFQAIYAAVSNAYLSMFSGITGLPPARRDLLAAKPSDSTGSIFFDSALWVRTWLSPDSTELNRVFGDMVESVTSGRFTEDAAVRRASDEIDQLFRK